MKNIKSKIMSGASMLLATLAITSCVDVNDWETDSRYNRLFAPSDLKITAESTTALVEWSKSPGIEYYLIEVNATDSLYGTDEDIRESSTVYGADKSITGEEFTLTGLLGGTKYYIRLKGCSAASGDSHWNYPTKRYFETDTENIFSTVTTNDRGETSITLRWDASIKEITDIRYAVVQGTNEETGETQLGEETKVNLTDEHKEAGAITIEGLTAATTYQFSIYNGDICRGTRSASTTAPTPEGNLKVIVHVGETLTQELLDGWAAEGSVTVTFEEGGEYLIYATDDSGNKTDLTIPTGLSMTFFGEAGTKPVIKAQSGFLLGGNHSYVRFENLTIEDDGCQYFFNQGTAASVEELSFTGCDFNHFERSIFRAKDQKEVTIGSMLFDDCVITEQGSGGYAVIVMDAKEVSCGTLGFNNVTFNGLSNGLVALNHSSRGLCNNDAINFTNCTFYNHIGSGKYVVDAGATTQGPTVTFTNCILGKTSTSESSTADDGTTAWTSNSKGVRSKEVVVNNTYVTLDGIFGSNKISGCTEYNGTSDDLFADPANGDFSIKDANISGVGDSRWFAN